MVDPLGLTLKGAAWFVRYLRRLERANTEAVQAAYASAKEDWRLERNRRVDERLAEIEDNETNRAAFERLLVDEFFFIQQNIEIEAFREATHERRRMLAFAAAGVFNLELSIPKIARVERTIRELDPADVNLLQRQALAQLPPDPTDSTPWYNLPRQQANDVGRKLSRILLATQPSGDILIAAACVRIRYPGGMPSRDPGVAEITDLGRWVLQVLDGYLRAQQPNEATPPRKAEP